MLIQFDRPCKMKIELEIKEEDFRLIASICEKEGLDAMECLQSLLSGAIESYLEDSSLE